MGLNDCVPGGSKGGRAREVGEVLLRHLSTCRLRGSRATLYFSGCGFSPQPTSSCLRLRPARGGSGVFLCTVPPLAVAQSLSRVRLCDPMDCGLPQAPLSLGCSRQEYWSGLPFPSPGDLPDPGIKPESPEPPGRPGFLSSADKLETGSLSSSDLHTAASLRTPSCPLV